MAEPRSDSLLRSRQEAALLLRLDPQNLSASDALRCDLIATLRLSIDSAQADALEGRAADLGRLIVATESLVKLLPSEPPKPASTRDDPREYMLKTYLEMRRRGALHGEGLDGLKLTVERLKAENEQLKAQLAEALGAPAPGASGGANAPGGGANTPPGNVVPMRPSSAAPASAAPAAPPKPAPPPVAAPQCWDDTPGGQAWHAWIDAGGPGFDRWSNNNF
jgi:hypothetical protein